MSLLKIFGALLVYDCLLFFLEWGLDLATSREEMLVEISYLCLHCEFAFCILTFSHGLKKCCLREKVMQAISVFLPPRDRQGIFLELQVLFIPIYLLLRLHKPSSLYLLTIPSLSFVAQASYFVNREISWNVVLTAFFSYFIWWTKSIVGDHYCMVKCKRWDQLFDFWRSFFMNANCRHHSKNC